MAERLLWEALRPLRMNFRRQVPIGRYIVDFAHHASSLLIEIDGYYHTVDGAESRSAGRAPRDGGGGPLPAVPGGPARSPARLSPW